MLVMLVMVRVMITVAVMMVRMTIMTVTVMDNTETTAHLSRTKWTTQAGSNTQQAAAATVGFRRALHSSNARLTPATLL